MSGINRMVRRKFMNQKHRRIHGRWSIWLRYFRLRGTYQAWLNRDKKK